jgi:hypothetical protein
MNKFTVFLCFFIFFVSLSDAFRFIPKKFGEADAFGKFKALAPCTIVDTFSASFEVIQMQGSNAALSVFGQVYFSYPMKFIRADEVFFYDNKWQEATTWADYTTGITWVFTYADKKCYPSKVNGTISPPMIPPDANLTGIPVLGNQQLESWRWEDSYLNEILVTRGTCIPVSFTLVNPATKTLELIETFENFIPSVNHMLFELPSECSQQKEIRAFPSALRVLQGSFFQSRQK